ncbi:MAG: NADH-quinone oxidoreductase subunit J [Cephaloticoccus sp.]|nr:NADH-quinone oxidoreductase subunit J [Cephaloticoccus sp.]MCF7759682.1 NADH-quinone oxidoreductase subunit J [Cephaloticoccus sp.]
MSLPLIIFTLLILGAASAALTRRNLIHSALLLVLTWAGIAGFYLWAGAEFVAFAQVLIYVGAISMVVLFAVLLTRQNPADVVISPSSHRRAVSAILVGALTLAVLGAAVWQTPFPPGPASAPELSVLQLGQQLMGPHAAAVLVIGVLLTVALLGATIIASSEKTEASPVGPDLGPAEKGTHQGAALPRARGQPQGAAPQKREEAP